MTSKVEICNMAIGNAGVSTSIASLDEKSKEAKVCKRYYDQVVNELLRKVMPQFATRSAQLALVEESPTNQWAYSYRYPTNCEAVKRIIPSDVAVTDHYRDPFVLSSDNSGKLIYSNQITAVCEYIYRVTDPGLFDSHFVNAVSWLLALRIAPSLTGNNYEAVVDRVKANYKDAISAFAASGANESCVSTEPKSEIMDARE